MFFLWFFILVFHWLWKPCGDEPFKCICTYACGKQRKLKNYFSTYHLLFSQVCRPWVSIGAWGPEKDVWELYFTVNEKMFEATILPFPVDNPPRIMDLRREKSLRHMAQHHGTHPFIRFRVQWYSLVPRLPSFVEHGAHGIMELLPYTPGRFPSNFLHSSHNALHLIFQFFP